jgi:hypothetical protein
MDDPYLAGCGKIQCERSGLWGPKTVLSLKLPKIARQAGFCVDFTGFCRVRADSGHGYATTPTSFGSRTRL